MKIPIVDITGQHASIRDDLVLALESVFEHGQFVMGREVTEFEQAFAKLCNTKFTVGLNSGLDALILALKALDIGPGDEVITAPNSYIASASAIAHVGARPVFVDVSDDLNLDPALLEDAISDRTKAILPVHLTGRPAEMRAITNIAHAHGLAVIEDAAQAVAAEYHGQPVGGFGTIGCFSLHPLKTLNACGDAGVITTNDPEIDARVRRLRNHGLADRDRCLEWGHNSRLDSIQAAILLIKLKHLDEWTGRRRQNARFYGSALRGLPGLTLPKEPAHLKAVFHTYVIQTDRREALLKAFDRAAIDAAVHYPIPIHLQPAAAYLGYGPGDFPNAEKQAGTILSLPVHHGLAERHLTCVVDAIKQVHSE